MIDDASATKPIGGGPAYPSLDRCILELGGTVTPTDAGMSILDYFAGQALVAMEPTCPDCGPRTPEELADLWSRPRQAPGWR